MTPVLPDVFLPYQQELWATVDANRLTVAEKSRRTGFSWALGAIAAGEAAKARSAGGQNVLYMAYEKEITREFIDYVANWAKFFQYAASDVEESVWTDPDHPEREIAVFRIHFASGFDVIALPSVARRLRGHQGLVILDEAAFMDDLDAVLKAAYALLIWGGRVVVCSTHLGDTNPFNQLINEIRGGKRRGKVIRVTFDEAVAQGLGKRSLEAQGKAWSREAEAEWRQEILDTYQDNAEEELNVIPNPSTGAYLPSPLIEARMRPDIPVLRLTRDGAFGMWAEPLRRRDIDDWIKEELDPILVKLDPNLSYCFGWDFARSGDLSVLLPLAIQRDLTRRAIFALEIRNLPFAQQKQVLWHVIAKVPRWRAGKMDARGNGQQVAEETVEKFGAWIEAVMLTETWYRENMPSYKQAFEDGTIELPRDEEILDDNRALKIVRGVARIPEASTAAKGKRRHGDAAIAGALAIAASRADPEMYGYEGAGAGAEAQRQRNWHDNAEDWDEDGIPPGGGALPALQGGWL